MGPPTESLVLVVAMTLFATLPEPTLAHAEVPDKDTTTNLTSLCSVQRRQDLLDSRMNERDSRLNGLDARLSAQLNGLDTRLSTELNTRRSEVNTRLNRMDSRLDGIEMAISDMKGFLQQRMEAIDKKLELALPATKSQPDTKRPQDGTERPQLYRGCEEALTRGVSASGVYTIAPDCDNSFKVYCEQRLDGGGWTVFQSRHNGKVDFYNDWNTYKVGFGELTTEFWLGNDNIHSLTKHHNMQLKVELTSPAGEVKFANYDKFWIDDEAHNYTLTVTGYSGSTLPGDSLAHHNGNQFSTKDVDNDNSSASCATRYVGGWWYNRCHHSNLNGLYGGTSNKGMRWHRWKGGLSMKATRMMIRRRS